MVFVLLVLVLLVLVLVLFFLLLGDGRVGTWGGGCGGYPNDEFFGMARSRGRRLRPSCPGPGPGPHVVVVVRVRMAHVARGHRATWRER